MIHLWYTIYLLMQKRIQRIIPFLFLHCDSHPAKFPQNVNERHAKSSIKRTYNTRAQIPLKYKTSLKRYKSPKKAIFHFVCPFLEEQASSPSSIQNVTLDRNIYSITPSFIFALSFLSSAPFEEYTHRTFPFSVSFHPIPRASVSAQQLGETFEGESRSLFQL